MHVLIQQCVYKYLITEQQWFDNYSWWDTNTCT